MFINYHLCVVNLKIDDGIWYFGDLYRVDCRFINWSVILGAEIYNLNVHDYSYYWDAAVTKDSGRNWSREFFFFLEVNSSTCLTSQRIPIAMQRWSAWQPTGTCWTKVFRFGIACKLQNSSSSDFRRFDRSAPVFHQNPNPSTVDDFPFARP